MESCNYLLTKGFDPVVDVAVILGSGLGGFTGNVSNAISVNYSDIPGFPEVTVAGHGGELIQGNVAGKTVLVFSGRFHHYEGHPFDRTVLPVEIAASFNARHLIVSNAAGGMNPRFSVGDLMIIDDLMRIGFPVQPLSGSAQTSRFENSASIRLALNTASELQIPVRQGTYLYVKGPVYETAAEIRAFRTLGADAVGMSTMPEMLVAHQIGLKPLGISLITNLSTGLSKHKLEHGEIKEVAETRKDDFARLVTAIIGKLD